MSITLFTFQFDKSGIEVNDKQLQNKKLISIILVVFHLDNKSGKDEKEQFLNI